MGFEPCQKPKSACSSRDFEVCISLSVAENNTFGKKRHNAMTTLPSPSLRDILSPSPAVSAAAGAATAGPSNSAYLSPLQHSLVYELTTRRAHIHAQRLRARFWREREQRLSTGSLDEGAEHEEEEELDRLIEERKARLELLRLRRALRDTIVENADAAFVINRSLSTTQPPPFLAHGEPALHVDG